MALEVAVMESRRAPVFVLIVEVTVENVLGQTASCLHLEAIKRLSSKETKSFLFPLE